VVLSCLTLLIIFLNILLACLYNLVLYLSIYFYSKVSGSLDAHKNSIWSLYDLLLWYIKRLERDTAITPIL
jgi:hypothetical protein